MTAPFWLRSAINAAGAVARRGPHPSLLTSSLSTLSLPPSLSHAPLTAYASILAGVLSDGLVGEQERTFCAAFRAKHGVTDEQHAGALRSAGWDVAAFEAGKLAVGAK